MNRCVSFRSPKSIYHSSSNRLHRNEIENIRKRLFKLSESLINGKLSIKDYKSAAKIFILVFLSTFPVAAPFIFISDLQSALRTSNFKAILMMFFVAGV